MLPKLPGHKPVGRRTIKVANGKTEVQPLGDSPVSHPLLHARLHRLKANLRLVGWRFLCGSFEDVPQIIPVRVGIEGAGWNEIAQLLLKQLPVGGGNIEARGISKVPKTRLQAGFHGALVSVISR